MDPKFLTVISVIFFAVGAGIGCITTFQKVASTADAQAKTQSYQLSAYFMALSIGLKVIFGQ